MTTWLIVGSSVNAREQYDDARQDQRWDRTITCNHGYKIVPTPTYWWLHDRWATEHLKEHYEAARKRGTSTISSQEDVDSDYKVKLTSRVFPGQGMPYTRGEFIHVGLTGPLMVQWAVKMDATVVGLVGFEGYSKVKGEVAYFDGRVFYTGESAKSLETSDLQGELFVAMALACPDVAFVFYGWPIYPVADLPNVSVVTYAPARA